MFTHQRDCKPAIFSHLKFWPLVVLHSLTYNGFTLSLLKVLIMKQFLCLLSKEPGSIYKVFFLWSKYLYLHCNYLIGVCKEWTVPLSRRILEKYLDFQINLKGSLDKKIKFSYIAEIWWYFQEESLSKNNSSHKIQLMAFLDFREEKIPTRLKQWNFNP